MFGKQPEVDPRAHRHKEQAEQQAFERLYVCLQLMAIFAVGQHHPGEEGAESGRKPHRLHQHGDGDHQQQGGGDEDLPHMGLGDGTKHRPHQVMTTQHDAGDGRDYQQTMLPTRQLGAAIAGDWRHGQQWQQRQDRNDRNILKQQHRKGGATALALHQLALLQALQNDGGGGERQNEADS